MMLCSLAAATEQSCGRITAALIKMICWHATGMQQTSKSYSLVCWLFEMAVCNSVYASSRKQPSSCTGAYMIRV